jgi:hypothetical protein
MMGRVTGRAPADDPPYSMEGWVLELPPELQRVLAGRAVATLAHVARVDWRALGLESVSRMGLNEQLAYLEHLYEDGAQDRPHPVIEAGLE